MPTYGYVILIGGWVLWLMPFFTTRRTSKKPAKRDRRARWGIVIQGVAYWLLWFNAFWAKPPQTWRIAISVLFFLLGSLLAWTAVRTLGSHWRIDAGLNHDHELVRSGPYRIVRHPIYASMFCTLLGTGFMVTPLLIFAVSLVAFLAGTEIRVQVEDGLLASRFGDQFRQYQHSVSAYIPFVR